MWAAAGQGPLRNGCDGTGRRTRKGRILGGCRAGGCKQSRKSGTGFALSALGLGEKPLGTGAYRAPFGGIRAGLRAGPAPSG